MRAARVAWMLEYVGAHKVSLLEGGYQRWKDLQYPTETTRVKPTQTTFQVRSNPSVLATANEVRSNRKAIILDVRSEGEFRGTEGRDCDPRLGRIPRARWIEWTQFLDNASTFRSGKELARTLKGKGLRKDVEIITYCHRGARAASAFYALRALGYGKVKNYVGSWHEWSARRNLPVEK